MTAPLAARLLGEAPKRLLDVGCADGATTRELASLGHWCVGLEFDEALATLAREQGTTLVRGDGLRLPFADGSFDRVICLEVLEHVGEPGLLVADTARVLRPGGLLVVAVPTAYTEVIYDRLHPRYTANARHLTVFRKGELLQLIEGAGLRVVTSHAAHLGPAIAWLLHALVRTDADHTGKVLEHQDIDRVVDGALRRARRAPGLGRLVRRIERQVGKSRYVYAERP